MQQQNPSVFDKRSVHAHVQVFSLFLTAFLRRGMAYKALKNQELAVKDFNSMLEIDPKNKRAKVV